MTTYTALALVGELAWTNVAANQSLVSNNGYFITANCTITLPTTANFGEPLEIALTTATAVTLAQNAGQSILCPGGSTTVGVTGSIVINTAGTALRLVCCVTNLTWQLLSDQVSVTVN